MPTVWAIWCPRGEECKRGNSMFAKGESEEVVRKRLARHLASTARHGPLPWTEAEVLAELAEVTSWEEELVEEDPGAGSGANDPPSHAIGRKRRAQGAIGPAMASKIAACVAEGVAEGIQAGFSCMLHKKSTTPLGFAIWSSLPVPFWYLRLAALQRHGRSSRILSARGRLFRATKSLWFP